MNLASKSNQHNTKSSVQEVYSFYATIETTGSYEIGAIVEFENGELGMIWQSNIDTTIVLFFTKPSQVIVGMTCREVSGSFSIFAGDHLLGRTISPLLQPLDAKPLNGKGVPQPVFGIAPTFHERAIIDEQLITGITMIDTLFPIVRGQRIAVVGDSKSGKTTFLTEVAAQATSPQDVIVYVMIAKKSQDVMRVQSKLRKLGVADKTVLVVASVDQSLALSYAAPYIGCAIAEHFWREGKNTLVFYDDLTTHAKLYRELALLLDNPAGREGYPADIFWQQASLLERSGKLSRNNASQTVFAVATTSTADLTSYIPTSMISMTDGQLVFDIETMQSGLRPALNMGVSVSRVGGRAQTRQFSALASKVRKCLAEYRVAENFSHFGAELSGVAKKNLDIGEKLLELFSQSPGEHLDLAAQYILLSAILLAPKPQDISTVWLKSVIADIVTQAKSESDYDTLARELIKANPMVKQ